MNKVCKILNVLCFFALILSVIFTSSEKAVSQYNTDADKIIELLPISDNSSIELRCVLEPGKLKGIMLYFNAYTEETDIESIESNGYIEYIIETQSGDLLYSDSIYVEQIVRENIPGILTSTELITDIVLEKKEVLKITLNGVDMPNGVKVELLGNSKRNNTLVAIKNGIKYPDFPLFQIEIEGKEYKYTWDILLIWSILFVFSVLIREKHTNDIKKENCSINEP